MAIRLKPLADQVILITGATSGIGLTTARAAAVQGARLALLARDRGALDQLATELGAHGSEVIALQADVGSAEEVARAANMAVERFGRIDTWLNNAGVSIFGRIEDVSLDDAQRLFQTNFWGVVNGSLEAVKHMKRKGGALINMGSEASDHAMPLQGMYAASKHAVKGFTDALRMELEEQKVPISVTLIKPAAVDTMFTVHAKNYMEVEPSLPAPIYAPELVADAILYAAQHPRRDVFVGAAAKLNSAGRYYMPRVFDKLSGVLSRQQRSKQPSQARRSDALFQADPAHELQQRHGYSGHVVEHCPYTAVALRSRGITMALLGGGALWATWRMTRPAHR